MKSNSLSQPKNSSTTLTILLLLSTVLTHLGKFSAFRISALGNCLTFLYSPFSPQHKYHLHKESSSSHSVPHCMTYWTTICNLDCLPISYIINSMRTETLFIFSTALFCTDGTELTFNTFAKWINKWINAQNEWNWSSEGKAQLELLIWASSSCVWQVMPKKHILPTGSIDRE